MFRVLRAISLRIVVAYSTALLATGQVNFTQTTINSGDTASNAIATGDFDNDGILDLITINNSSLSFYKGLGRGNYAGPINQPLASNLGQVLTADFNRYGRLDLAIAGCCSPAGGVTILMGNGNGTFAQGTNIRVTGSVGFIALADFNGDRLPDLAVSINGSVTATEVLVGRGDGTFRPTDKLAEGGLQVVAGDFDADGHQDLAVVSGPNVVLYLGSGNGTFKPPLLGSLANVSSIAVGDFYNNRIQSLAALVTNFIGDGNFENDIFTLHYTNGQWLVENHNVISAQNGDPYQRVVGGDLNGDFKDDIFLVGGNFQGSAVSAYMLGNGNGTFQTLTDAPHWLDLQNFPFVRDLDLDSRHDVGIAFTSIFDSLGGAEVLGDTAAAFNCTPPHANALSVHICTPSSGQTVGKTFTFKGAGNAWNGVAKRMELWIDGKKAGQSLEDQLRVMVSLARGQHTASFVVVDSFDNHVSGSVSFTSSY